MGIYLMQFLSGAFTIYYYLMLFYIISSWFPKLRFSKFGEITGSLVEPYLRLFRKIIPPIGMVDISPIVAFFVYQYLQQFALRGLYTILQSLGLL